MRRIRASPGIEVRRAFKTVTRTAREVRMFVQAMHRPSDPILANIVPVRRCNLACTYCNQYDQTSQPVPAGIMIHRLQRLIELGTQIVTFTGGEPLLHPDLDLLTRTVREQGAICTANTNGLLLTRAWIERLNRAGLDYLLVSIDNVEPDETSSKSLKVLDRKLELLARYAHFEVTVNSVLGTGVSNPEDAYRIAVRATELGFTSTIGLLHGEGGQLVQIGDKHREVYRRLQQLKRGGLFSFAHYDSFQNNLVNGLPNQWHCVAGGRFLYICEDGLVHYCSQRRGKPGIPLEQYTREDIRREGAGTKACAPFCTIPCVHQTSMLDSFRTDPQGALQGIVDRKKALDPDFRTPVGVQFLERLFLKSRYRKLWSTMAVRAFGRERS